MGYRNLIKTLAFGAALGVVSAANANMILNGSFENNQAGGTQYNLSDAGFTSLMADTTSFGAANEMDIITTGGYGFAATDGVYKVAVNSHGDGVTDGFTFNLSSGMVGGQSYTVSFDAYSDQDFSSFVDPVEIGVSNSSTSFGTLVYTSGTSTNWVHYTATFVAPTNSAFLSVQASAQSAGWEHIDNFALEGSRVVPEPASMTALGLGILALIRRRKN